MSAAAFAELERSLLAALETYSNVHRGSGQHSLVSTHLYEQARQVVLDQLGLDRKEYTVIFCSPRRAEKLKAQLNHGCPLCLSSQELGLPLGVRAVVLRKKMLPGGAPFQTGGGTARLVSPGWVIWAHAPDRFEAGTPAIINVIAFARALQLESHFGRGAFHNADGKRQTADEILYHDDLENYSGRELLAELRQTLIGCGARVPTTAGLKPYINLDNGASTPTFMPVWQAVRQAWRQSGAVQQEILQEVRSICAEFLGAPASAYDVIFTSNTTEAINLASEGLHRETGQGEESVVVNTLLEHNSNELPWRAMPGFTLIHLPVDAEGFVDPGDLESLLLSYNQEGRHGRQRIRMVAVSGASNVLGTFNDLAEISRIVHRYGARLLVDGAQLVAHRRVEMEALGIDYLAFSAHKAYAPFGSGALVVRKGLLPFTPEELAVIRASGEENFGGIAALGKALVLLRRIGLDLVQEEEQALTAHALRGLARIPGLTVFGIKDPDSPHFARKGGVIVFELKGLMASGVARALAEQGGIGVRYGCHCAHLLIKRLIHIHPLLEQFQGVMLTVLPQVSLPGLTRVSLGFENSTQEVDTLLEGLSSLARQPGTAAKSSSTEVQQRMDDFLRSVAGRVFDSTNLIELKEAK